MDTILTDQLEWLISGNMEGLRFKRQLVLLAGCLADSDGAMPAPVDAEIMRLIRRTAEEEVFHALLDSLNTCLRQVKDKDKEHSNLDITSLIAQVEAAREELKQCEPANTALIVGWILGKAKERKLLGKARGMR